MNKITIIGLGFDEGDLSLKAQKIIKNHDNLVARTGLTKSFLALKNINENVKTLDFIYEKSRNFDTLNKNLALEVLSMAKVQSVCYLVDGCSLEDNSVKHILKKHKNVEVIAGVTSSAKCLERLKKSESFIESISAYEVGDNYSLTLPLVVYAIDSVVLASKVKLFLGDLFGEEIDVYVTSNSGSKKIKLFELDRLKNYDYSLSLYIESVELTKKQRFDFNDLLKIIKILRSKNGCPWDREQTEETILKNVIEEAYELVDAVESFDDDKIIEETGDLILQSAFYIIFGEEGYRYSRSDVLSGLCQKLISRHTHVFGNDKASSGEDALSVWNSNKIAEKGYDTGADYLKAVPSSMPSVMRAEKVQKRAKKYNFDFDSYASALEKVKEEILELEIEIAKGDSKAIEEECGDLLFSAINVLRLLGVEGELALKRATEKFINRFTLLESEVNKLGKDMKKLSEKDLDDIYNLVKERNKCK